MTTTTPDRVKPGGTRPGRSRSSRVKPSRILLQAGCIAITLFMLVPLYLIALAAFSSERSLNQFPLSLAPSHPSTQTMSDFLASTGVVPGFLNSLQVGVATVVLALLIGVPGGYALGRYLFRGRDVYQLFLLLTRALPIVVLAVPLAQVFLTINLYDTTYGVTILHTVLALPTTVLISGAIFVAVPRDHEEAAKVFGASPLSAFVRVVLPQALPGIAASAVFAFVLSWNEVLGAAVLTLNQRTLPAQVLGTLSESPLRYRFAGGFALVVPALVFIAVMRRYLLNMWGTVLR